MQKTGIKIKTDARGEAHASFERRRERRLGRRFERLGNLHNLLFLRRARGHDQHDCDDDRPRPRRSWTS